MTFVKQSCFNQTNNFEHVTLRGKMYQETHLSAKKRGYTLHKLIKIRVIGNHFPAVWGSIISHTWCCTERCHLEKFAAACYLWWPRGNWLLSHLRRINRVSRWNLTWTGPDQESRRGILCKPGGGRSIFAAETRSACSPGEKGGENVWKIWGFYKSMLILNKK